MRSYLSHYFFAGALSPSAAPIAAVAGYGEGTITPAGVWLMVRRWHKPSLMVQYYTVFIYFT